MTALFAAVAVPAETQPPSIEKTRHRPRFWVGPLVAGSCFALGFGITTRIVAMQGGESTPSSQAFNPKSFPGLGLQSLRDRFDGASKPLQADVAAREAELAKTRPPKPNKDDLAKKEAERLAAQARRQQQTATRWAPAAVTPPDDAEVMPAPEFPEAIAPAEPMPATANSPAPVAPAPAAPAAPVLMTPAAPPAP